MANKNTTLAVTTFGKATLGTINCVTVSMWENCIRYAKSARRKFAIVMATYRKKLE
jgi:hypothetical protein